MADVEAQYVASLDALAELASPGADALTWNTAVRALDAAVASLSESPEGRLTVERQLTHADATARTWAASHVASWNPSLARPILVEIAQLDGMTGFNARETLRALDAGTLST